MTLNFQNQRNRMKYKRILLKLSGDIFGTSQNNKMGLDFHEVEKVAQNIESIRQATGIQIVIVYLFI